MIKKIHFAAAVLASLAAASVSAQGTSPAAPQSSRDLTRAEVKADLEVWKRAGMHEFSRGDTSPDTNSAEYRAAFAEYTRMRQGSEYQDALRRQSGG